MIKILLDHGGNKTAKVEDLYFPVDLLNKDRIQAKSFLELTRKERKSCGSSGSESRNGSPTPPAPVNDLDATESQSSYDYNAPPSK